ncbi:MAG: tRNA (guanosine(46)-N7)-methyltransferase TrmB [Bacteroidetes bacterium]|nr:tRNA (guanosine(46)-N7)-methyltransferase TrmB [Bacteroidota bacterium]MCH8522915.1 tRNA (guanosine(46)-N7)-methyltransferase TrmB [Balneolales bacterium]
MAKRKLQRYSELADLENVIELEDYSPTTISPLKGRWCERIFGNENPLVLELACGKGDYTLSLAKRYPNKNFIGIDIKGDRIWRGAVAAHHDQLDNVRFLRIYIDYVTNYFAADEVDEIWITFPDPYLGTKKINKRLTSPFFLKKYREVLKRGAFVHLKTDSPELFEYTTEVIEQEQLEVDFLVEDVHNHYHEQPDLDILTYYERMHLADNRVIRYVRFRP